MILQQFWPFLVSLLVGFVIGLERENHNKLTNNPLGIRTFILVSMAGTLAAWQGDALIQAVVFIATAALSGISYFRTKNYHKADYGLTTEVAAAVVCLNGMLIYHEVRLGAVIGVLVLAVLVFKAPLHVLSKKIINPKEIQAATVLLILMIGFVPYLPEAPIDPFGLFSPKRFALILTFLSALQFGSHLLRRLLGDKAGLLFAGVLGGLVSSTTVVLNSAQPTKEHEKDENKAVMAFMATAASLSLLLAVVAAVNMSLALSISLPILAGVGLLVFLGYFHFKKSISNGQPIKSEPLKFREVLKLGTLLASLFFIVGLVEKYIGSEGTFVVSFLAGLFELHAMSLATVNLFATGGLNVESAQANIFLATFASFISKIAIALFVARKPLRAWLVRGFLFSALVVLVGAYLTQMR